MFGKSGNFYIDGPERSMFTHRLASLLSEVDGSSGPILDIGIRVYRRLKRKGVLSSEERGDGSTSDLNVRYSLVSTDFIL